MCIAPVTVNTPDGAQLVSCRECWQCRQRKIDDYVGRCIAETKTSVKAHAFTLTYGTDEAGSADHIKARLLMYSDVQKFFKKLRAAGYPCRYFVVGEYGERKGRTHWHGMIFWQANVPKMPIRKKRVHALPQWEHGYSFIDEPSVKAVRYACKYIQKDMHKAGRLGMYAFSRFPPLGAEYFKRLAEQYVRTGKAPNTLDYWFPEITRLNRDTGQREVVKFRMRGKAAEIFLDHFLEKWREAHGKRWVPPSQAVEEYQDKLARREMDLSRGPQVPPPPRPLTDEEQAAREKNYKRLREAERMYDDEAYRDEVAERNYVMYSLMKVSEKSNGKK